MNRETRTKRAFLALGLSSALLLPAGCASSRNADHIELLHNELRLLEDDIYALEHEVKDKEQQLNAAKRENDLYKEEIKALNEQRQRAAAEEQVDILPPAPGSKQQKPQQKPADMGTIEAPVIEAPKLPFQGGSTKPTSPYRQAQYAEAEEYQLAQGPVSASGDASDAAPQRSAQQRSDQQTQRNLLENHWKAATVAPPSAVDHITIHPRLSGGHDSDRKPGHDGLQVVFAPRDAQEQPLQVRGAISVVLVDPELKARSARWEYSIDESQQFFKKSLLAGEAYHLDLRWPLNPPTNADQELHVRFTTSDGQRHEASTKLILQLPGAKIAAPPQAPPQRAAAPQQGAPPHMTGTPTLAPPQYLANDPPPVWNGPSGGPSLSAPNVTGPQLAPPPLAAGQNFVPPANSEPAINITVPDVGSVPSAGSDQRLTIAQRLQQRRAARLRGQATPSLDETGNLALPTVEAPALPGMSVPNLNLPGTVPAQPGAAAAPAKPSGWRSLFSNTPLNKTPEPKSAAPAYGAPPSTAIPGAKPDAFVIIPANPGAGVSPTTNVPGVSPSSMAPPPLFAAPQLPNDASRTATKPEWKPFR